MERMRMKLMQDQELYQPEPTKDGFGEIPGIKPGATFPNRKVCAAEGVHRATFAGIHGSAEDGAYSICLSGGYEDDKDEGDFIVYTGTGGREDSYHGGKKHINDQSFYHPQNASLKKSVETKRPVRVVRGSNLNSRWAPESGYRYDGLYTVEKADYGKGVDLHRVCKFELRRDKDQPPIPLREI